MELSKRIEGFFTGVAVYDALGIPSETLTEEQIAATMPEVDQRFLPCPETHPFTKDFEAGQWSDDTQLTLSVARGIVKARAIDLVSIAQEHLQAADQFGFAGWGTATRNAVKHLRKHGPAAYKNSGSKESLGNGVLMKMGPLALAMEYGKQNLNDADRLALIEDFTRMTHDSALSVVCAATHLDTLRTLLQIQPDQLRTVQGRRRFLEQALQSAQKQEQHFHLAELTLSSQFTELLQNFDQLHQNSVLRRISHGGECRATDTLTMVYGLVIADPTIAAAHRAVRIGGDTDSNASIVGGMIGLLDGAEVIPAHLRDQLWQKDLVKTGWQEFAEYLQQS